MYAEIAERRAAPDLAERTDVLSRLLQVGDEEGLSDHELRDQLVTLLLAGHETTATALAWALYELGRDAGQHAHGPRARAAAGDDDYLEAVLKESMRLHPVIPMVVRHLMAPATIGGIDLPRGANVGPSIILATPARTATATRARSGRERFLEGEVATNTWIPFGGGVRRCIGAGFSLMEGVAVLREVLATLRRGAAAGPRATSRRSATSPASRGTVLVWWWAEAQTFLQGISKKTPPRWGFAPTSSKGLPRAGHRLRAPAPSPARARHRGDRAPGGAVGAAERASGRGSGPGPGGVRSRSRSRRSCWHP